MSTSSELADLFEKLESPRSSGFLVFVASGGRSLEVNGASGNGLWLASAPVPKLALVGVVGSSRRVAGC